MAADACRTVNEKVAEPRLCVEQGRLVGKRAGFAARSGRWAGAVAAKFTSDGKRNHSGRVMVDDICRLFDLTQALRKNAYGKRKI